MMTVTYLCGMLAFKQWVCLEHEGFARRKAMSWWMTYAGTTVPETVQDALHRQVEIRKPVTITVLEEQAKRGNKTFDRVISEEFV